MYSILITDDDAESRKVAGSGIKKHVLDKIMTHQHYLQCLDGHENGVIKQKTFKSKGHHVFTIETERNAGTCYDDKRYFFADKNRPSLAYGHYSIR